MADAADFLNGPHLRRSGPVITVAIVTGGSSPVAPFQKGNSVNTTFVLIDYIGRKMEFIHELAASVAPATGGVHIGMIDQ